MQDLGCKIWDARFGMQDLGCKIWDARFGMQDLGCKIWDARFRMQDLGCKMQVKTREERKTTTARPYSEAAFFHRGAGAL